MFPRLVCFPSRSAPKIKHPRLSTPQQVAVPPYTAAALSLLRVSNSDLNRFSFRIRFAVTASRRRPDGMSDGRAALGVRGERRSVGNDARATNTRCRREYVTQAIWNIERGLALFGARRNGFRFIRQHATFAVQSRTTKNALPFAR